MPVIPSGAEEPTVEFKNSKSGPSTSVGTTNKVPSFPCKREPGAFQNLICKRVVKRLWLFKSILSREFAASPLSAWMTSQSAIILKYLFR